jgi:hypothetical protein
VTSFSAAQNASNRSAPSWSSQRGWTRAVLGSFGGLAGRGSSVRFRMLHVFEFRGGLLSRENGWMDTASVLAQLAAAGRPGAG